MCRLRNDLKRPRRAIPDIIRNLPDASTAVFRAIRNRGWDDVPVFEIVAKWYTLRREAVTVHSFTLPNPFL